MKVKEAPEKIYLDIEPNLDDCTWHLTNPNGDSIEYTRTDTFIEKACDWLRTHSEADYFELIPDYNYCGAGNLNKKKMIEDFKKYMKEE